MTEKKKKKIHDCHEYIDKKESEIINEKYKHFFERMLEIHRITSLPHALWIEEDECSGIGWITSYIKI